MKKLFLKSSILATLFAALCSCSGGGDAIESTPLSVSEESIKTTVLGETKMLTLESPSDWQVTTTGNKWISFNPTEGKAGTTDVEVTIKPNDSGRSRSAEIRFKSGEEYAIVRVSQEWALYFTVPCSEYSIDYRGGDVIIGGLPDRGFSITIPVAARQWMTSVGNTLRIDPNTSEVARNAIIKITDNSIKETYEILIIQECMYGSDGIFPLNEFIIDGYSCPADGHSPEADFLYSVDDDATTTTKTAKVEFSGEGVHWITIGDDNKKIYSGDMVTFTNMEPGAKITIHSHNEITDKTGTNTLMVTCLPIVTIYSSATIQNEPKVDCNIAIFDPKKRTDAEEKNLEYFESKAGIEYRGAGALRYPKKPYNFKLYDSAGNKREAELLNIRNDNSWILDAMYLDMGRMRNRVCFDLWNSFNKPYYVGEKPKAMSGTRGHYVEVFINGKYMGLFVLSDRIDRKQYQIEPDGGYIYKAKGWTQACYLQGYSARSSNDDYYWNSAEIEQEYPGEGDGAPNFNHMADFIDFVSKTSKAEFNAQFANRVAENSVIDTFIFLNLILAYDNAGRNTFWIYRNINESKKMIHGLWDLDGSLGRDWNRVKTSSSNGWFYGSSNYPEGSKYFKLFKRIMDGDVEGLKQKIYNRWIELRDNQLAPAEFNKLVDYYSELQIVSGARDREVARWRAEETYDAATGTDGWIHYSGNYGDVEGERDYMKKWYKERVERLDQMLSTYNGK